jgi:tRNA (mo5U34)-methyltransferase
VPPFDYVREWRRTYEETGWWHSFELPDGTRIRGVNGLDELRLRLAQFPIPCDLAGKRVLDVGAWDGWFSFEIERRGAEVVAIDCWDNPRFRQMHSLLRSRVGYRVMDLYDLSPRRLGRFDIVLFLGVLYHVRHPLLALERICAMTDGMAAVESFVMRSEERPLLEFYETGEMGGETDCWFGPSLPALVGMCRAAGFPRAEFQALLSHGAAVSCYRDWEPPPRDASAPPVLVDVCHARNWGINVRGDADEYLSCWFDCAAESLSTADLRPEVGAYGARAVYVGRVEGNRWQANFRLPPGLDPGWRPVRLRTASSGPSNAVEIAVDVPLPPSHLKVVSQSGDSLWIEGLPDNADRANLEILADGVPIEVTYVQRRGPTTPRQVNLKTRDSILIHRFEARLNSTALVQT